MTISYYAVARGLESRFDLCSSPWFYRSKFERWAIVRLFGIYFWIVPKQWRVF